MNYDFLLSNEEELTSKRVFAERKVNIDNAYNLAQQLILKDGNDEWNQRAYAWCLIDLVKRESKIENSNQLSEFIEKLNQATIPDDEVLVNQKQFALNMANPYQQELNRKIGEAKELSQKGEHKEAANAYFRLLKNNPDNLKLQENFAWELYHLSKIVIERKPLNIDFLNRYFNEYFKLNVSKPSLLHQCFLRIALKVFELQKNNVSNMNKSYFDFGCFICNWGLDNLSQEDYKPSYYDKNDNGVISKLELQPNAISVFRYACQSCLDSKNYDYLSNILEYIYVQENYKKIVGDNIWVKWDLAKSLHFLGRYDEAKKMTLELIKEKASEYWLWEFLGDICGKDSIATAIQCYSKALTLQKDINFVAKLKIKLAQLLIENELFMNAKNEISEVIRFYENSGKSIPENLVYLSQTEWYITEYDSTDNQDFYISQAKLAMDVMYSDYPWIKAVLGCVYERNDKKFRTLFIQNLGFMQIQDNAIEVSIPENKIVSLGSKNRENMTVFLKGEWVKEKFSLYMIKERESNDFLDIFPKYTAVIDHINMDKKLAHFIINERIDFTVQLSELDFKPVLLDVADVYLSQHTTKEGKIRFKAKEIRKSPMKAEEIPSLVKLFSERVEVNNHLGFTEFSGVFIEPRFVEKLEIKNNAMVDGVAIRSFDKKKRIWGWKAININSVDNSEAFEDDYDEPWY